jgi:hypothetical protein
VGDRADKVDIVGVRIDLLDYCWRDLHVVQYNDGITFNLLSR